MSDTPAEAAAPPKSKKMLLIIVAALLVIGLAAGGGWFYISKQRAAALDGEEEAAPAKEVAHGPPVYLPMDNMVVNLSDPGGEKVVQVGITLELLDSSVTEKVKQYLPTIRSSVLLLISQRTSEELLQREGKEKLQADILRESLRPFGGPPQDEPADDEAGAKKTTKKAKPKKAMPQEAPPVKAVLFSSFIVQ